MWQDHAFVTEIEYLVILKGMQPIVVNRHNLLAWTEDFDT
jgi:hypothetical protein